MKKGRVLSLVIISVLILSLSFGSASWFGDLFQKITGKVTVTSCTWDSITRQVGEIFWDRTTSQCKICNADNTKPITACVQTPKNGSCQIVWPQVKESIMWTAANNTPGLYNFKDKYTDQRFICLNNKLYECGWELSDTTFAFKAVNAQVVGSYKCDLTGKKWLPVPTTPPPVPTCTYTYSDWNACQSNNIQNRTVLTSSPTGCTGTPILTQPCTYTPPASVLMEGDICKFENTNQGVCSFQNLSYNINFFYGCGVYPINFSVSYLGTTEYFGVNQGDTVKLNNGIALKLLLSPCAVWKHQIEFSVPPAPVCNDSDGGLDYYVKGTVVETSGESGTDVCSNSNTLMEFFCSTSQFGDSEFHTCPNGCSNGVCLSEPAKPCASLIDKIKNPTSTEEKTLNWNNTYIGNTYVNDQSESFKEYSASWYWNAPVYQENQINYYYVNYDIQVFDNENVDLNSYASWQSQEPACKSQTYWINGEENYYFICNWDALSNTQDINNYQGNNRQIFWYKDNVIVRMYLYWGNSLTDAQVTQLSQKKLNDLINSLQNNQYEYLDWTNFNIDWPAGSELDTTMNECGSDVQIAEGQGSLSWSCIMEPAICPPHGQQTRKCQAYNSQTGETEVQENIQSCNPGMCSGCMVPKWFGNDWESKCIPYGFRFAQESGGTWEIIDQEQNENLKEQQGDVTIEVLSETEAKVIFITTEGNFSYNLVEGSSIDITEGLLALEGDDGLISIILNVEEITPASEGVPANIKTTISYKQYQQQINSFNAYCDIDGQIKQQKLKEGSEWAQCQNNYECFSNICSSGECVELGAIASEANAVKAFFVKMICKLSNLLSTDGYNQCVYEYLGGELAPTTSEPTAA